MPNANPPTSNPSLSSSSSVGVVMRDAPIIFAFEIMGDGAGKEIFGDEVPHLFADARLAWTHLDANNGHTAAWLASSLFQRNWRAKALKIWCGFLMAG